MELSNDLRLAAFLGSLFTISALCILLIRNTKIGIILSFAPVVSITIYFVVDVLTKYEKIPRDEGIVFVFYFFLYLYFASFAGTLWGAFVRYLMANAKVLQIIGQRRVIRFAAASTLVFAPAAINTFTTWDRQREANQTCFTRGIPIEIGGRVFAPKPIRRTGVNVLGRGQTYDDQITMDKRQSRRELCDLSKRSTRPIPASQLTFLGESAGNTALFLLFNPGCDRSDLKGEPPDAIRKCSRARDAFMPYFKRMSLRNPSDEYWLLSAWGLNIRGDPLDAVTSSGTAYRYRCSRPIESSFYQGGKQCIAYRYIQKELVAQIIFKTWRNEEVVAVLNRFELDLAMILTELEWRPE